MLKVPGNRAFFGLLAALVLCGCTSTTTPVTDAETAWTRALELEQQGRTGDALDLMRGVIESGPHDEGRAYYFGRVFVAHASLPEVEAFYESYLPRDPEPQTSHFFWANALARHGRADLAEQHLDTALEIDPAHEMSHMGLAEIAAKQGRTPEAIEHLRTAVAIHPEFAQAHARLAEVLEALGRHDEAADHRDLASRSNPNTTRRFYYWGRFLLREGRVEAAIAELEQAVRVDAEDEQARALLEQARQRLEP